MSHHCRPSQPHTTATESATAGATAGAAGGGGGGSSSSKSSDTVSVISASPATDSQSGATQQPPAANSEHHATTTLDRTSSCVVQQCAGSSHAVPRDLHRHPRQRSGSGVAAALGGRAGVSRMPPSPRQFFRKAKSAATFTLDGVSYTIGE